MTDTIVHRLVTAVRRKDALLTNLGKQLRFYESNHRAKGTPDAEQKADVNRALAEAVEKEVAFDELSHIETVRAPDVLGISHAELVTTLNKPGEDILAAMTPEKAVGLHMALGSCGEAGELADAIKRWAIYGKPLDRANVIEEFGDLEFFMQGLRELLDIDRQETLDANITKLSIRYQDLKYSDRAAIERADKA